MPRFRCSRHWYATTTSQRSAEHVRDRVLARVQHAVSFSLLEPGPASLAYLTAGWDWPATKTTTGHLTATRRPSLPGPVGNVLTCLRSCPKQSKAAMSQMCQWRMAELVCASRHARREPVDQVHENLFVAADDGRGHERIVAALREGRCGPTLPRDEGTARCGACATFRSQRFPPRRCLRMR
jgi:hypothetical protein